ncbi:unnamed protein product, partial [Meganyctiphanes norvegica]
SERSQNTNDQRSRSYMKSNSISIVLLTRHRPIREQYDITDINIHYKIPSRCCTEMLEVPPQPRVVGECTITQVEELCTVDNIEWVNTFKPPSKSNTDDPNAADQEMKQMEKELQKLILIKIKLPDSAFWFEPPLMVLWDDEKQFWSTEFFQDVKYNEDVCTMQVRTTRLGVMGLAMNRYANLPFQNWEISPGAAPDTVKIKLCGAVVVAAITIKGSQACVSQLQEGSKAVLTHLYGKYMKLNQLIKTLQFYGINLFPERDSYCYIDGLPHKHRPTEQHLYRCMALVAPALSFTWSRWNLLAGEDKLVFQMKSLKDDEQTGPPLVLVTPSKTCILDCTEISQAFSDKEPEGAKYYADLLQLAMGEFGDEMVQMVKNSNPTFIHTISHMIQCASVISYC